MSASNGVRPRQILLTQEQVEYLQRGLGLVDSGAVPKDTVLKYFKEDYPNTPALTARDFDRLVRSGQLAIA